MNEKIGIVGLGKISGFHVAALESLDVGDVYGGVDLDPSRELHFRGNRLPVWQSVSDLLARVPTTVIVATPTSTHREVCRQILSSQSRPARLIVEKPLTTSLSGFDEVVGLAKDQVEVSCVYHAAHAPEVMWGAKHIQNWLNCYGAVVAFEMSFADPYGGMERRTREVFVNSWLDSGINALSVALRFVCLDEVMALRCLDSDGSVYQADVRFESRGLEQIGLIRTSWNVSEPAKSSRFVLDSGAVLRLDHQGVSGRLEVGSDVVDSFQYDGPLPRLAAHYRAAFDSLLGYKADYYNLGQSRVLHELLLPE
jgi:predicted dehydrogenase